MTNAVVRGLVALTVSLGLGAGAAAGAVVLLHDHREQELADVVALEQVVPGDRVVNALAGIADDGVYVAPDARTILSKKGERAVAAAIAASTTPVQVVVWSSTGTAGGTAGDLANQLETGIEASGVPGVLLLWEGPEKGRAEVHTGRGYLGIQPYEAFAGDPDITLPRLVDRIDDEISWYDNDSEPFDYWGGLGGGIAAGLLIGSGILGGIFAVYGVIVLISGERLPGGWLWRRRKGTA